MMVSSEQDYLVGIDVGSLYVKGVLLKDNQLIASSIQRGGRHVQRACENVFANVLAQGGITSQEVTFLGATGVGRKLVPFTENHLSEITCQAAGIHWEIPEVKTIIDIGGQDSKAIKVGKDGRVDNFVMNDKCAAGTGRFLEVVAQTLEVSLEELSDLAERSSDRVKVASMCTIFAESEVISYLSQGVAAEDIVAGVHEAIMTRVVSMARRLVIEKTLVFTGGVAQNTSIVKELARLTKLEPSTPSQPQITAAIGCAVLSRKHDFVLQ